MKPFRAKIQKRDNPSLVQFVSTSNEIVRFRRGIHSDPSQSSPVISYPKGREKNLGRTRSLESARINQFARSNQANALIDLERGTLPSSGSFVANPDVHPFWGYF